MGSTIVAAWAADFGSAARFHPTPGLDSTSRLETATNSHSGARIASAARITASAGVATAASGATIAVTPNCLDATEDRAAIIAALPFIVSAEVTGFAASGGIVNPWVDVAFAAAGTAASAVKHHRPTASAGEKSSKKQSDRGKPLS